MTHPAEGEWPVPTGEPDKVAASRLDSAVRQGPLVGEAAYQASLAAKPNYSDGRPRKTWEQLGEAQRRSWFKTVHDHAR